MIRQKLAETPYTVAFGYAEKKLIDSVDEALVVADKRMFEDKIAIKKAKQAQGVEVHMRE